MPFFSVLIPSYNRPEYLPKAVASVLSNSFVDFELLVSDDASPRQAEIRTELQPYLTDSRLQFVQQPVNIGEARSRAFLINKAQGEYLIVLSDDDLLLPTTLERLKKQIELNSSFDLFLFGYNVIDERGQIFETRRALAKLEISLEDQRLVKDFLCSDLHPFWFYHPATFCLPSRLRGAIEPNHTIGIGDDVMYLFDVVFSGYKALVIPEVLFSYRKFAGDTTYLQTNQSCKPLANALTRRHIMYSLLQRTDLDRWVKEFVESEQFRRRFVYDSVITDVTIAPQDFAKLALWPQHLAELQAYWRCRHNWFYRNFLMTERVWRFTRYFGLKAVKEVASVAAQRRSYRSNVCRPAHS